MAASIALGLPAAVVSSRAGGIVFWVLVLLGVRQLVADRRAGRATPPWLLTVVLAATLPVAVSLSSVIAFDLPWRELAWVPTLGLPFAALAASRLDDPLRWLWIGAMTACIAALACASYSRFVLGEPLPAFMMNPLLFGQILFLSLVVAAWGLCDVPQRRWRVALLAVPLAGVAALLMSGFRGALGALPLLVASFLRLGEGVRRTAEVPWRAAVAAILVGSALFMIFRPHLGVIDRLAMVEREVREYSEGRVGFSSIGTRLALWHASIDLAERRPWFGMGVHRFREGLVKLREEGRYPPDARLYDHAHNTYLSLLVEVGIAGLAAFTAAVALLLRALWSLPRPARALGVSLLACLAVFALTNDVLAHQNLIRVAVLSFACCLGARRLASASLLQTPAPVRAARAPAVVADQQP